MRKMRSVIVCKSEQGGSDAALFFGRPTGPQIRVFEPQDFPPLLFINGGFR
jgi:hypothetical protein